MYELAQRITLSKEFEDNCYEKVTYLKFEKGLNDPSYEGLPILNCSAQMTTYPKTNLKQSTNVEYEVLNKLLKEAQVIKVNHVTPLFEAITLADMEIYKNTYRSTGNIILINKKDEKYVKKSIKEGKIDKKIICSEFIPEGTFLVLYIAEDSATAPAIFLWTYESYMLDVVNPQLMVKIELEK